jgi:hypothetical protein
LGVGVQDGGCDGNGSGSGWDADEPCDFPDGSGKLTDTDREWANASGWRADAAKEFSVGGEGRRVFSMNWRREFSGGKERVAARRLLGIL